MLTDPAPRILPHLPQAPSEGTVEISKRTQSWGPIKQVLVDDLVLCLPATDSILRSQQPHEGRAVLTSVLHTRKRRPSKHEEQPARHPTAHPHTVHLQKPHSQPRPHQGKASQSDSCLHKATAGAPDPESKGPDSVSSPATC